MSKVSGAPANEGALGTGFSTLWDKRSASEIGKLTLINEEDLPVEQMLENLKIHASGLVRSFGLSDPEEIRERLALTKLLRANPELVQFLQFMDVAKLKIPSAGDKFVVYYDERVHPRVNYWQWASDLVEILDRCGPLPARVAQFKELLNRGISDLEPKEKIWAQAMVAELSKVSLFEGSVRFQVYASSVRERTATEPYRSGHVLLDVDGEVYGQSRFSSDLDSVHQKRPPEWARSLRFPAWRAILQVFLPLLLLGVGLIWVVGAGGSPWWLGGAFVVLGLAYWEAAAVWQVVKTDYYNRRQRRNALSQTTFTTFPESLKGDLRQQAEKCMDKWCSSAKMVLPVGTVVEFCFSYDESGLSIRLLRVIPPHKAWSGAFSGAVDEGFEGFEQVGVNVGAKRRALQERIAELSTAREEVGILARLSARSPESSTAVLVPSRTTDAQFRWFAVSNLAKQPEFKDTYQLLNANRRVVLDQAEVVRDLIWVLDKMQTAAKTFGLRLSDPVIAPDEHVVEFTSISPFQLVGQVKTIRRITGLPQINGNLVGLSGIHGGGKTETLLSVGLALYLAQSGLPVFAENFRFNIKRVIGVVLIPQRGVGGSTCMTLVDKLKRVMEGVHLHKGSESLVIMDELGAATQEDAGRELGEEVLTALKRAGVSVIFSTQILDLMRIAQDKLGGLVFHIDSKRKIHKGIGAGQLDQMTRQSGLKASMDALGHGGKKV